MLVMEISKIRNFSIIAHIDHGKSTLADRMLEITGTIEERKMKEQLLDTMELERERGITIKMQPVRMEYKGYIMNLIDTPGHIDFSYEVSRALRAVEGSLLLVDATQGVQAQTLTTLNMAKELGIPIIPVLSKVDSPLARVEETKEEISKLLGCDLSDVYETSGKTGQGVEELLDGVIEKISEPIIEYKEASDFRALVFDFKYSTHRGIIVYVRVLDGEITKNTALIFRGAKEKFNSLEVGTFSPDENPKDSLLAGEIGYIVTGIKKPGVASVGDTITLLKNSLPVLDGYEKPKSVVWASIYPEDSDDFNTLRLALGKLQLSDASFTHDEETSGALGRGFRCGFLGMLHLEIITESMRRELRIELIVTHPSISYEVHFKKGESKMIYSPVFFPEHGEEEKVLEPWISLKIMVPSTYLGNIMQLFYEHEVEMGGSEDFGDGRLSISAEMPLRELMRNFFDQT